MVAFVPIACLIINMLFQIASFRYILKTNLLRSVFVGVGAGAFGLLIYQSYFFRIEAMALTDRIAMFLVNLLIYASLSYCYFSFICLSETARRIRILREIYDARDGLSMQQILERYNAKEMIDNRLKRLLNNRQITFKSGRYYLKRHIVLLIARLFIMMKLIIFGKKSEFD